MAENIEMKITDLNNDCFIEICRNLNWKDLYSLKLAHDALADAIEYIAQINEFNFMLIDQKDDVKLFEGFVKLYGGKMKCLNIKCIDKWSSSVHRHVEFLIEHYCVNEKNKHCKFDGFKLRKSFFMRNISFFHSLKSLNLNYLDKSGSIDWLVDFIGTSKNIREICVTCDGHCEINDEHNVFQSIALSNLEICHLNFNLYTGSANECKMNNLPMNYILKELDLGGMHYDPIVLTYFPNIECLKILNYIRCSLNAILTLPKLRTLKLVLEELDTQPNFLPFLAKLGDQNSLESFTLIQLNSSESNQIEIEAQLANSLLKMTNLKILYLMAEFQFHEYLPQIGNCLKKLKEFTFFCCNGKITGIKDQKKSVQNLLNFVKTAKKLTVLDCTVFEEFDTNKLSKTLFNIRKTQRNTDILNVRAVQRTNWPILSNEQRKFIQITEREGKQLLIQYGKIKFLHSNSYFYFHCRLKSCLKITLMDMDFLFAATSEFLCFVFVY